MKSAMAEDMQTLSGTEPSRPILHLFTHMCTEALKLSQEVAPAVIVRWWHLKLTAGCHWGKKSSPGKEGGLSSPSEGHIQRAAKQWLAFRPAFPHLAVGKRTSRKATLTHHQGAMRPSSQLPWVVTVIFWHSNWSSAPQMIWGIKSQKHWWYIQVCHCHISGTAHPCKWQI